MKAFVKILMLAAILTISVDAVAISKSKFMVKAMDKMVGEPETALFDNLGRPDKTKVVEGTSIYKWHGGGCTISVETKDEKVVRWFITGRWKYCWSYFLPMYHKDWLHQPKTSTKQDESKSSNEN